MQYTVNNEQEAIAVFYALQSQFGWAGGIVTREGAARIWAEEATDWDLPTMMGEDGWKALQRTHEWGISLTDCFHETVEDIVRNAVTSAILHL